MWYAHLWCSGSHTWDMTIRAMPSSIFWGEITCVELPSPLSTLLSPTSMMPTCNDMDAEECRRVCKPLYWTTVDAVDVVHSHAAGTTLAAHHTAKDASQVILVELALEKNNCKQGCEQHLCPSHHLVNGGCD